jgi:hypothetical protein
LCTNKKFNWDDYLTTGEIATWDAITTFPPELEETIANLTPEQRLVDHARTT